MRTSAFSMLAVLSYVAMIGAMPAAENNRRDVDVLGIPQPQELPSILPPLPVPPQELPAAHLPHVELSDLPAPVKLSPLVDIP